MGWKSSSHDEACFCYPHSQGWIHISHIMKTFDRVVREVMVCDLEVNNKLNPDQHGFRNRRSYLLQLFEHDDKIHSILEGGKNVDSVNLDFAKAVDQVDKRILCQKLGALALVAGWASFFIIFSQTGSKLFLLMVRSPKNLL